ncbi:immunity protein TriTu family protein [Streptomyces sp. TN58]|uniref:immunity protein TriTu family protein n=1 Tax=Streptomyces sp. TN58 TaxID=234612 RepID=UPI003B63A232
MPLGVSLLASAQEWIHACSDEVRQSGVAMEINNSPVDRDLRSIQWILESSDKFGEIILWESGEAEVSFAVIETSEVRAEHRAITSRAELEDVLTEVLQWVIGSCD